MKIRVLIADDDPLIREGLQIVLEKDEDFAVAAVAEDGRRAVELCRALDVDVALLDVRMPVMDGVEAARLISESGRAKVIMLTTFEEDELIRSAVRNGAKGYLLKGKSAREIKDAIKLVHGGSAVFQGSVFERMMAPAPRIDETLFTDREGEIVRLVAEGLSNRDIAERLFLSEGTVKNYISSILSKLGLRQRTQIATYYFKGE